MSPWMLANVVLGISIGRSVRSASGFTPDPRPFGPRIRRCLRAQFDASAVRKTHPLRQAPTDADDAGGSIDAFRRMLETSWKTESMGAVPTSPEAAAEATAACLLSAQSQSDDAGNIFFVDLWLPQYDISQGTNLYDEVLAVDFCIELANRLRGKSQIIVKDSKVIETVSRILRARGRDTKPKPTADKQHDISGLTDVDVDFDDTSVAADANARTDDSLARAPSDSMEGFRQQLMAKYEAGELTSSATESASPYSPSSNRPTSSNQNSRASGLSGQHFRLTSFFGTKAISQGADMAEDVVDAVKQYALPETSEDAIIILSAIGADELIAVRGLAAKYAESKTIVLVNCKLDPLPRELMRSKTIYSLLPLIAQQRQSDDNLFAGSSSSKAGVDITSPPKIVVLRRFPRDWEVYVDVGKGFELAASAADDQVDKRGPSMLWITTQVKSFLLTKGQV